ncbi:MAG: rRNA maturation RNase YbeY [Bacteroidales bacterium]|nr:rRNA maturation RNase YbeY [Bacteroidales bacterium]MDD4217448.1 rRNA maturation RNase YbeY [Bacteroidales bacterium]MDY0141939.1 rRNA maturation RNase YbeY [Bacteroidales bacterium]
MSINFFNEDVQLPELDFKKIKMWVVQIIEKYQKQVGDINYIFCSDEYLLEINQKHLNHDYFTDIISFNYCENNVISGDVFISTDRVSENAKTYQTSDTELLRVIIHGVLHFVGFDDQTKEEIKKIRLAEDQAIAKFIG